MLKGEAYLESHQKRAIDVAFASILYVPERIVREVARLTFAPSSDQVFFYQQRIGKNSEPFEIAKIRTLDARERVLSELADKYRRNGIDELPQIYQIFAGYMSAVGRRPLPQDDLNEEYVIAGHDLAGAKLVDRYKKEVLPTLPGCISEYVVRSHMGEAPIDPLEAVTCRMEQELAYIQDASARVDLGLIALTATSIIGCKMVRSSTAIHIA